MTQSFLTRLRRVWLTLHLWLGVGLMVVLVPLSVSGALLVWHDALDRALYAQRYAVSGPAAAQSASAYATAAQTAFAGQAALTQLRLPFRAGDPVVAVGRILGPPGANGRPRTLNAWIDPPTAKVLATAEIANTATMVIHRLHGQLLVPTVGRRIVGWLGWAMFVSAATGLWLWWPRHANGLKGLRWRRGASPLFNLHHMTGFWLCLPLAVLSLSGVYIAFPQASHALLGAPPPPGPGMGQRRAGNDPRFAPPLAAPHLTVDQAVGAALAEAPGATLASVNLPQAGKGPAWRIEVQPPGKASSRTIRVGDFSGAVKPAKDRPAGSREGAPDKRSRWIRRLHDGTDMGPAWRTIITAAGIAPLVLSLSGLGMWLRRRARRLKLRPA